MSTVPRRRSQRIAVAKTKEDSKLSTGPKTKAALREKRARAVSSKTNDADTSPDKKPRKRAKTSAAIKSSGQAAPARKRRGKLSQITETPLDVLYEIFSLLEPLDLLRLSRTTKTLRVILMNKKCKIVWKSAFRGMGDVPPIIEGLNEPHYASLLYDDHCDNCLKAHTKHVQWQIRMRLCKECLHNGTIMESARRLPPVDRALLALVPCFKPVQSVVWYHRSTVERLVAESADLPLNSQTYKKWLEKRKEEHLALVNSCKPYEDWVTSQTEARAAEIASLRRQRLESILARLKADGWEPELTHRITQEALKRHRLVKQTKELTDQNWENIRPTLTTVMSDLRVEIQARNMREIITERTRLLTRLVEPVLRQMPETPHKPPPSALCTYEPFVDIIKNTPLEGDVSDKLKEALPSVAYVCEQWRHEQEARLKTILRGETGRNDDLSLVVNGFACTDCHKRSPSLVLHYPHFASHPCFYAEAPVGDTGVEVKVWRANGIKALNQDVYDRCRDFVRMCGLDPDTATAEDMDGLDLFFRCEEHDTTSVWPGHPDLMIKISAPPGTGTTRVGLMRWRRAMNDAHLAKVTRVEGADLIAAGRRKEKRRLEDDLLRAPEIHWDYREEFVCVHCGVAEWSRTARVAHARDVHGVDGKFKLTDCYKRSLRNRDVNDLTVSIVCRIPMEGEKSGKVVE
ncbi:hypothetical protein CPB85DRAFT_1443694 [Mucidula mucida]|nr:hypothetical protein CPB85DRAFT_1443694 [Mucidula mucida]